jgi:anti-anti-sigma regulatory factor
MLHEALQPRGEILLQLDGVFDAAAARALRKRLNAVPRDAKVVVDFGQVRALHDLGVADLAAALAQRDGPAVTLRGLCQHQHRMLRYFGVDLDAIRAAHAPLAPELRATR